MSQETKQKLELLALAVSLLLAGLAFGKAWFTLPYRLEQAEMLIQSAANEKRIDHELLVRIDERLKQVQQDVSALKGGR